MTDPVKRAFIPYRQYGDWHRPVVTVEVAYGPMVLPVAMLIDTGADNVVLPEYLLEVLQISTADCEPIAAGTVHGLQMGVQCSAVTLFFSELWPDWSFDAPAVFAPFLNVRAYGLLGREPTLEHLSFHFGHKSGYGFTIQGESG